MGVWAPDFQNGVASDTIHYRFGFEDVARSCDGVPRREIPTSFCKRSYVTTSKYSREEVADKLDAFHGEVLGANWADYLYLVYNVPFWEAEFERLGVAVQPYLHEEEMGAKYKEVQEIMDVLYQCEHVRDHLNELAELVTRASGLMGTGLGAEPKVVNMDENAQACVKVYEELLAKHPGMKPKIEQTIGHGLAVLRQKHKFKFATMHRYFF